MSVLLAVKWVTGGFTALNALAVIVVERDTRLINALGPPAVATKTSETSSVKMSYQLIQTKKQLLYK